MSKRAGLITKALFFVILFAGICWTEAGDAYEPWEGKATTGLNVRKSPGVGGQVMTWLQKGQNILISDEKEKWYKIVFDMEGKKDHEGWVHSRYIQRIFREKEEISSALERVRSEIVVEELQERISLKASTDEAHLPTGKEKELDEAPLPAAMNVVEGQARVAPGEGFFNGKNGVEDSLPKGDAVKERTLAASQAISTAPETGVNTTTPPTTPPVVSKRVDTPALANVPVVEESITQGPTPSHDKKDPADANGLKELTKLALRLLSVVLSCLAILFSYKAMQLAKISYNTAMQFQRNLQAWQQRENGQTD